MQKSVNPPLLPGGGVEDRDRSLEAALLREIDEELGGQAVIHSLLHIDDSVPEQRQYIFLARIDTWDIRTRCGPEFNDPRPRPIPAADHTAYA
ncbi:NUDIX domain-containing protein [Nonomuraea basaltis]|uniref:NUDIX domain-containing protein n=1 Tax=Nonomuraea basaltis TaxID=2495887 RepID=UPI001485DC1F|nr:NUDIX hydrolase [Nonomuraea basaltis]